MWSYLMGKRNDKTKANEFQLRRKYDVVFFIKELDFAGACRALTSDRSKAKLKDADGFLPLHLTLMNRGSERLIALLIDAYPGALLERDPMGRMPFHIICSDPTCLLSFVRFVLRSEPKVLQEKDPRGDLPCHMSIRYRCPAETTLFLLDSFIPASTIVEKDGNLPLHLALRFGSDNRVIYALVEKHPEGVRVRNSKMDLPIHRASLFNSDLEILKTLVKHYPESMAETDAQGNLPIHLYFMQMRGGRPDDDVMHFLIENNPASLGQKNKAKCTPLQVLDKYHEQIDRYTY